MRDVVSEEQQIRQNTEHSPIDQIRWSSGQMLFLTGLDRGKPTYPLEQEPSVHIFASGEGATTGGRTVSTLLADLRAQDAARRITAAREIARLADIRAVPDLLDALDDARWMVRTAAAYAIGQIAPQINDLRALPGLLAGLGDQVWVVRRTAAWALGRLGDERGASPLITSLSDHNSAVREAAVWALGQIGGERCIPRLKPLLQDNNTLVQQMTAHTLGRTGSLEAQSSLFRAFETGDEQLRQAAAEGLGMLGEHTPDPAVRARIYNRLLDLWSDIDQDANLRRVTGAAMARIHASRGTESP